MKPPVRSTGGFKIEGNIGETRIDLTAFHRCLTGAPMRSAALTGRGGSFEQAYHNLNPQSGASSPGGYFELFFENSCGNRFRPFRIDPRSTFSPA